MTKQNPRTEEADTPSKPNLLFLFTDEQRWDTLATPGFGSESMPHLNRFAARSTVFEETYCTQPVCTPSRGSIMTGLYPHSHGATFNNIDLNPDARCLPELLDPETRARYATAYIGKWHLGDEIFAQHGFDQWVSLEDMYHPYYSPGRDRSAVSDYSKWLCEQGFLPDQGKFFSRGRSACLPENFTKAAFVGNETCRFLKENKDRPFIAYANFLEPHMPFFGPLSSRFDPNEIEMPETFDSPLPEDHHLQYRMKAETLERGGYQWYDLKDDKGWRQLAAAYYGLCKMVDNQLGKIFQTLEEQGLADNTIVVFTSDHGEMMGSHRLLTKSFPYQESSRVPMLIRTPGQQKGKRITGPLSQIDIVPTLLDLFDEKLPVNLHGKSVKTELEGEDSSLSEDVFFIWDQPADWPAAHRVKDWEIEKAGSADRAIAAKCDCTRSIVTPDGWRYTHSLDLGEHELFNLKEDPCERENLANKPEHRELREELTRRIAAWQNQVGDPKALAGCS